MLLQYLSKEICSCDKYEYRNEIRDIITNEKSYILGYWKGANHIHKWFVDNIQNGEDDCNMYKVSIEQLRNLLEVCKQVKQDNKLAETLLPITEGFFFGHTRYDEKYFEDIEYTIETIEKTITEYNPEYKFYYRSSW